MFLIRVITAGVCRRVCRVIRRHFLMGKRYSESYDVRTVDRKKSENRYRKDFRERGLEELRICVLAATKTK